MSSQKKLIVVFGATGTTGGSVAKYLLEDGTFAVRAVTRNVNSEKAKALKAAGAEVVQADLDKAETIPPTLVGAYGVSGLTDFWTIFPTVGLDPAKAQAQEEVQGRLLVDASKAAGVKHFVWFDLWHSDVPHWEGKYQVGEYLAKSGLPYTRVVNAFYMENLSNPAFGMFKKTDDGKLLLTISQPADTYVPSYSANQSGGWVLPCFKNPEKYLGKTIKTISEHLTPKQFAETLSKAVGKPVELAPLSNEEFEAQRDSPNPYVKELYLNMKGFLKDCQPPNSVYGSEADSAAIYPGQYDFATFVQKDADIQKFIASLKA
ncbi:NAD(P)-binding protein [Auriculariales sp. MPI-PUGE-AT-0066]|nr:NAD(P)-binding protein [Auriculariales sp. MPI-PUGE-AT-0066]